MWGDSINGRRGPIDVPVLPRRFVRDDLLISTEHPDRPDDQLAIDAVAVTGQNDLTPLDESAAWQVRYSGGYGFMPRAIAVAM